MLFERTCRSNTYVDNTSDTITIDDLFFCQQGTIWNHGKPIIPRSFSIVVRAHSSNIWVGDQWMTLMQGLVSVDRFPQETNSDMCISTTLEAWSCVQISCTRYVVLRRWKRRTTLLRIMKTACTIILNSTCIEGHSGSVWNLYELYPEGDSGNGRCSEPHLQAANSSMLVAHQYSLRLAYAPFYRVLDGIFTCRRHSVMRLNFVPAQRVFWLMQVWNRFG